MNNIEKYIAYPLAITIFKQDIEKFKEFKMGNTYLDMLESIIERMQKDFYKLKSELLSVHHTEVRMLENGRFKVNNEVIEYTSKQLRDFTKKLMSEYLYGDRAEEFEEKERIWKPSTD